MYVLTLEWIDLLSSLKVGKYLYYQELHFDFIYILILKQVLSILNFTKIYNLKMLLYLKYKKTYVA